MSLSQVPSLCNEVYFSAELHHYLKEYNKIQHPTHNILNEKVMAFDHKLLSMQRSKKIWPIIEEHPEMGEIMGRTETEIIGYLKMRNETGMPTISIFCSTLYWEF